MRIVVSWVRWAPWHRYKDAADADGDVPEGVPEDEKEQSSGSKERVVVPEVNLVKKGKHFKNFLFDSVNFLINVHPSKPFFPVIFLGSLGNSSSPLSPSQRLAPGEIKTGFWQAHVSGHLILLFLI